MGAMGGLMGAHVLQVQYNPSSITFRANASERAVQTLRQYGDNNMPTQITHPPSITMSVELIFDAVNVKDSFTADKLEIASVSGVVSSTAAIVRALTDPYTVQPQTNGLLALIMVNKCQRLTFHWSDTTFSGEVNETQARYTMFSVGGRPVRSTVQLQIRQQMENKKEKQRWNDKFDKCFGDESFAGDSGRISANQAVGNLLNLGF
jgi:hypothetical protein